MKTSRLALLLLLVIGTLLSGCRSVGTPKVIYLARHGQTAWNRVQRFQGDPDLDPVGYINRASLWRLLKKKELHEIYTSGAKRTQRTAELVAQEKGLKIQAWPEINEIQAGVFTGFCWAQMEPDKASDGAKKCIVRARGTRPRWTLMALRPQVAALHSNSMTAKLPLGESYADLLKRSRPFIDRINGRWSESSVLIVGHGVINRVLLHKFVGWSLEQVRKLKQSNDQVYRIENAGKSNQRILLYTPGVGWKVCSKAPQPGDKHLDCDPGPQTKSAPPPAPPASAPSK